MKDKREDIKEYTKIRNVDTMLPYDIMGSDKESNERYAKFMQEKCGPVIRYNINDLEEEENV